MSSPPSKPMHSIPRPSSSLVIVNAQNQVLLVQRNPKSTTFGGFHVFPGGNMEPQDQGDTRITAIRETFEECGILFSSPVSTDPSSIPGDESRRSRAREMINSRTLTFSEFLASNNLKPQLGGLLPFTQWITPNMSLKRYHTQFYVVFMDSSDVVNGAFKDGVKQVPTPDGGNEIVATQFIRPQTALSRFNQGEMLLMPPQYYILVTLASLLASPQTTQGEMDAVQLLSKGPFGRQIIHPQPVRGDIRGKISFVYEGDETRGGSKGRLHRSNCELGNNGVITKIELLRNFDIFSEIEESGNIRVTSKL